MEVQNCIHESANLELDAEVARFMCLPDVQPGHLVYWYNPVECGWTAYPGPCDPSCPTVKPCPDRPCYIYRYTSPSLTDMGWRPIPHYSSDLAAAWRAVEHVRDFMYWFCLFDMRETPDRWRASFCKIAAPVEPIDGFGATPAEAICLAVVKIARIREATEQAVRFVQGHVE